MQKSLRGSPCWIIGSALFVLLVVELLLVFRLPSIVAVISLALFAAGVMVGRSKALGVGILGALGAVILIPPGGPGFSPYIGPISGGVWLLIFAIIARRKPRMNFTMGLFVVVLLLGSITALAIPRMPLLALLVAAFTILIGYSASALNEDEKVIVRRAVIVMAAVEAVMCLIETFYLKAWLIGDATAWPHPVLTGTIRGDGTLGHPLAASMVVLVGLTLVITAPKMRRMARPILVGILLGGIFSTGSSSAYVVAIICLLLPLVWRGGRPARFAKAIVVLAVGVYVMFNSNILNPLASGLTGVNASHRLSSILASPRLLINRDIVHALIGTGWGSAEDNYKSGVLTNDGFFAVDNEFVTVMMATGAIGFVLFCIFLWRTFAGSNRRTWLPLVGMVLMFLSFDIMSWASTAALFIVLGSDQRAASRLQPPSGRADKEHFQTGGRISASASSTIT